MSESVVSTTRPVGDFTGHCPVNPETLQKEFEELNSSAQEQAKLLLPACKSLSEAWDDLLPVLNKMQGLLSQRGKSRELFRDADLPTWSGWWKTFKKNAGLDTTLRNVQIRLRKYRGLDKPTDQLKPEWPSPPVHWSPQTKERMLKALQIGCDLAAAIDGGGDPSIPLHEFQDLRIDSDYIRRQLETMQGQADSIEPPNTPAAAVASAPIPETPATPLQLMPLKRPLRMPKGGDHSALFEVIDDRCGEDIRATLAELEPNLMATVIGATVRKIINKHCHYDREAGEIIVNVEFVTLKPSALEAAA